MAKQIKTKVRSGVVTNIAIGVSIAGVGLLAAGIIGFSVARIKTLRSSQQATTNGIAQVKSSQGDAVELARTSPSGSGTTVTADTHNERLTDISRDYDWDCRADGKNSSPMINLDTTDLYSTGKVSYAIDDPDAIRSYDDLPGVYVPSSAASISEMLLLGVDRVRVVGVFSKGNGNLPEFDCAVCSKEADPNVPGSGGFIRTINQVYSWPDPTMHGRTTVEELMIGGGISSVTHNLFDGYRSPAINIIDAIRRTGTRLSAGDTIKYVFVAIDKCDFYNCCGEAVGEFVATAEMLGL